VSGLTEVGNYVMVRSRFAGVFAGTLVARIGMEVTLENARRIWYWAGAASLSELSQRGTSKPGQCKFPPPVKQVVLTEVIEIVNVTDEAKASIEGVANWTE
jgi:hypothetical protein